VLSAYLLPALPQEVFLSIRSIYYLFNLYCIGAPFATEACYCDPLFLFPGIGM
jgi:hypothetical protein